MAFPPLWNDPVTVSDLDRQPENWHAVARSAGERLVEDLAAAEARTGGWSNSALTDMLVDAAVSECLGRLVTTGCWGQSNRPVSQTFWKVAGGVLQVGWLQHRARFKPCGYAGDYVMLARICEESCCDHPLGRAFDRYFLRQSAPRAVRLRTRQTAVALVAHCLQAHRPAYRVVSFGSGPAVDIHQAMATLPPAQRASCRVRLVDLDPNALDHARGRLAGPHSPGGLECVRANLFRVASPSQADVLGRPDFLVCPGLFDYLDPDSAARTLTAFWQRLAPGGRMLVGNFAPHNASRAYMEWIGNWYLIYRTPAEMQELALRAGIPRQHVTVACEPSGVNLFLEGRKP